ncbi:MAG: exosortase/archaeosortase family protein [Candidatus Diapherotrites archaeon]|nr:exosortase/archaeosortase family protein [Candidatus Diapherotrites archaeon]
MKKALKSLKKKGELKKGAKFTLIALIIVLLGYVEIYPLIPWSTLSFLTAQATVIVLNVFGLNYLLTTSTAGVMIETQGFMAEIVPLCTGYLELIVLSAFILASEDRTMKSRLQGVLGSIVTVFTLNTLRIAVTAYALQSLNQSFSVFIHDVLFRAMLFVVIVGVYSVWYLKYSN